jgi:molecular chaperone GrpE
MEEKDNIEQTTTTPQTESAPVDGGAPQDAATPTSAEATIAELEKSVAQYKDQLLRKAAEFDNFKKRTDAEYLERIRYASESLIEDLLPVIDDLERSLKAGKGKAADDIFYSGIELVYQKFLKILASRGMKPYDSLGKSFDTAHHDALMQMAKAGVPPHTVIEEIEKGYMLHDKVLRHAKVVVSADEPAGSADAPSKENQ